MAKITVHAGDMPLGVGSLTFGTLYLPSESTWSTGEALPLTALESVEVATEESVKKVGGTLGWGIVGGLTLGAVGMLAGLLVGGRRHNITFVAKLMDGRRMFATTDSKTFTRLQAACFRLQGSPVAPSQPAGLGSPAREANVGESKTKQEPGWSGCLFVIIAIAGLAVYGKMEGDKKAPAVSQDGAKLAQSIEIGALLGHYKDNEVRADGYFKGRIVEFSGVVGDIKKDLLGDIFVTLGTGQRFEIPQAQCFFGSSHEGAVARLTAGSRITVRGRVDGLMMNVLVRDCVVVP